MTRIIPILTALLLPAAAFAHDTWVQTNTHIVRTGDAVHIDLMLGNHGNDHRDFKIAGKLAAESVGMFEVVAPDGKRYDLRPNLTDLGYAPKEGYHTAKFAPGDKAEARRKRARRRGWHNASAAWSRIVGSCAFSVGRKRSNGGALAGARTSMAG